MQLFHLEQDAAEAEAALQSAQASMDDIAQRQSKVDELMGEKKRAQAKHLKEAMVWDKKASTLSS